MKNERVPGQRSGRGPGPGPGLGSLHGVPVTVKDTLETAGLRTTGRFPPLVDYVPG
jgi:Asp-tRNA(Asn)/Glu-tRNA(Gln) amidotransferase A subunit family amidase